MKGKKRFIVTDKKDNSEYSYTEPEWNLAWYGTFTIGFITGILFTYLGSLIF